MIFSLGDVFRRKGPRGKCVRITGTTATGGILVRPCNPDGSGRGVRRRLMWPMEFENDYVRLGPATAKLPEESV
jgi:hypothetical protein